MAKKQKESKDTVLTKVDDVAETAPVAKPVTVSRINSQAEAEELIKSYHHLVNEKVLFVTEDRNVFIQRNESKAYNHAEKHNLKIFRIDGIK